MYSYVQICPKIVFICSVWPSNVLGGQLKGEGKIGPQNENKCLICNNPVLTPQKKRKRKEENEEKVRRKPKKESNIKKEV